MEESYETFEEELWPPRSDACPARPVGQVRRKSGEMYTPRKIREEVASVPLQSRSESKAILKEQSFKPAALHKTVSIQSISQIETPWESVTLNRCLFVAITILVLSSGFQRLHEILHGQAAAEEEQKSALRVRSSAALRHRGQLPEPQTSLWEVILQWLPNLDEDEEEDEDDIQIKRRKSKREVKTRASRGLRNRLLPEKNLLKQSGGKLKARRARKTRDNKIKNKRAKVETEEPEDAADDEDVGSDADAALIINEKQKE